MVRTQIQLSEAQSKALKILAVKEGKSVAELIRQSVDAMLARVGNYDEDEQRNRALSVVGKFNIQMTDLAEMHDLYLSEDYRR